MPKGFHLTEVRLTPTAKADYSYWQQNDPVAFEKINRMIEAAFNDPDYGIGKPERLRHQLKPTWSRRINSRDRMVYTVEKSALVITQQR